MKMNNEQVSFKDRIKELRIEACLTQAQLAVKVNKGESAIRTWETGRAKPDVDTLMELAKIFDCSIDYLLGTSLSKKVSPIHEMKSELNRINEQIEAATHERDECLALVKAETEKLKRIENTIRMLYSRKERLEEKIKVFNSVVDN